MQSRSLLAALALALWAAIAAVPFLSRIHYLPLPQWFGEMNVVWLTLVALLPLALRDGLATFGALPRTSLWLLLLALVWAVQPLWVPLAFPGLNAATAWAFAALALLGLLTQRLRDIYGDEAVYLRFAQALLVGTLLQSLIGFAQVTGLAQVMGGVLFYDAAHPTSNVFGHLGQRNQYAHYLAWGVAAAGYLWARRRLATGWAVAVVAWLALSMAWAGSRTVLLYAAAFLALALIWALRVRDEEGRRFAGALAAASLTVIALQFALPWVNQLFAGGGVESGVERIAAAGGEGMNSRRFAEWHKAWLVFGEYPVFGAGWSQFAAHSVALQMRPEFAEAAFNSGLFANSHNLVLQLLAETGVVGTGAVLLGLVWLAWPFFGQRVEARHLLPVAMLSVTLIHSQVEYPLWYLYFPAVAVVALSLSPAPALRAPVVVKLGLLGLMLALLWLSVAAWPRYRELVNLYTPPYNAELRAKNQARLASIVENEPMFAFHALNTLDNYLRADREALQQKRVWITRLAAFRPYPDVLLKKAQLEALAGDTAQARQTLAYALASFPTYAPRFMATLAGSEPAWAVLYEDASAARARLPERYR